MPELPEVESIMRSLKKGRICHQQIKKVRVFYGSENLKILEGKFFKEISRRGKYLLFHVDSFFLIVHLRMSGKFFLKSEMDATQKHEHVFFDFFDGRSLCFFDPRKFGTMQIVRSAETVIGKLGPEPLEWDQASFCRAVMKKSGGIKALLLNQTFIAGLGNIYIDEALWLAKIHPLQAGKNLCKEECEKLHHAIVKVLQRGLEMNGTSLGKGLANFQLANGESGKHQECLDIYGRKGLPCKRCGNEIKRINVAQRGTHFCSRCQMI